MCSLTKQLPPGPLLGLRPWTPLGDGSPPDPQSSFMSPNNPVKSTLLLVTGWCVKEPEQGDVDPCCERSVLLGADGVRPRSEVLPRARRPGAERPVRHDHRHRRHPLGHHRAGHLEGARQTVHATRRLPGVCLCVCVPVLCSPAISDFNK